MFVIDAISFAFKMRKYNDQCEEMMKTNYLFFLIIISILVAIFTTPLVKFKIYFIDLSIAT